MRSSALELAVVDFDRSKFLGGSDAAGVLKCSPYNTPVTIYLWKIGEPTPEMIEDLESKRKIFRRGKREEPHVVDDLAEDYGIRVVKRSTPAAPNRYFDPEHPFLAAEIDYEFIVTPEAAALVDERNHPEIAAAVRALVGTTQNGEVKTHHIFARNVFGTDGSDEVPIDYVAQAMHGMMVTGRQLCMYGVRSRLDDLRVYWILRDDESIAAMRKALVSFWFNNVLARVEPNPINLPDVSKLLMRRESIRVEASAYVIDQIAQLEEGRAKMRVGKEQEEEAKFQIGRFVLGEDKIIRPIGPRGGKKHVQPTALAKPLPHEVLIDGRATLVINLQRQNRIDTELVRKDYPDVAAACGYDIRFFRFDPPKRK